jgi:two-component system response regulator
VARDGAEALDYLFATGVYEGRDLNLMPQLMLLDLKLPKISGLEVLQRLRNDGRTKYIPVVVLTSSSEERDIVSSYDLGANSYVQKPVDFNEFMEATKQLGAYWLIINKTAL